MFGFFALTFVTPVLRSFIPGLGEFNAISPGLVVGIMIVPIITSLSEDAMASVPNKIREGAYGLGATKLEVATKVVLPAKNIRYCSFNRSRDFKSNWRNDDCIISGR